MKFENFVELCQQRIEKTFNTYLNSCPAPTLQEALAYSVFNGGKRIRPLLVYATGYAFDATWENLDAPACAIELIHSYSLVHDDLPAMDNADLRRGKPSCHKKFNDAIAILAGDALQPLAFEIIATHPAQLSAQQRLAMIKILSHASGMHGMVAGQTLDILGTNAINEMYQLKTGALLTASVTLGALAANVTEPTIFQALNDFSTKIGLAFQLQDDLLDVESAEITGKSSGLDLTNQKKTFSLTSGNEHTQQMIVDLFREALLSIEILGEKSKMLHAVANLILQRKN